MRIGVDARELEKKKTGAGRYLAEILKRWPSYFPAEGETFLYFKEEIPSDGFLGAPCFRKRLLRGAPDVVWEQVILPRTLRVDGAAVFWGPNGACPALYGNLGKIVNVHDLSYFAEPGWFSPKERFVRRLRARIAVRAARVIVATSEATRAEIARIFPWAAKKTRVVHAGADHCAPSDKPSAGAARRILFVGSIFNRRKIENLLGAAALLKNKFPDVSLDVVGDDRTRPRRDWRRLIGSLGLEKSVSMRGYVDERGLSEAYRGAAVFCFPSRCEGFGFPILEAQRAGLPVVTLKNSSLEEIGGDSVVYAATDEAKDLASALGQLFGDDALRREMAERGARNSARYRWDETGRRVAALVQEAGSK